MRTDSPADAPSVLVTPARLGYGAAVRLLASRQKPGPGVPAYTRWVNRQAGRYLAAGAHVLGLTPNAVTLVSAAVSAAAVVLLLTLPATPLVGLAVAALLALGYALDSADGQVARLSGRSGPAGEWFDHVVDAIRTPTIHLAVLVALVRDDRPQWLQVVALAYTVLCVAQFMSQILAEQLGARAGLDAPQVAGRAQSWVLLPTDNGTFCWLFVLWGLGPLFVIAYAGLFALNLLHTAVSMRRKYQRLTGASRRTA